LISGDQTMANAAAPQPKDNMGAPAPRYDARLKVTGQARYSSDIPVANPAYAVLVTSAVAKGTLTSLNLEAARAVPGVVDILTAQDMADLKQAEFGTCSTSIQSLGPEIFHAGQIIAVVVGDTFEAATEAAYRVQAAYREETPAATFDSPGVNEADATKESKVHKHVPQAGDAESAIASADVVLDAEYATPTQHHNPIELFTTTCAWRSTSRANSFMD
jgi:xanthine dehydrogenase YagR molybdenum-binding subunit